jgi:NitT/TauT family transport system substrate-binding protein
MLRRTLLRAAAPLALASILPRATQAANPEIRFARQFSMGYLQFNVMERQRLVEKHAAALGAGDVTVSWNTFNGPDAMNGALIADTVDVVAGGIPGLVTLWARTKGTPQEVRGISALSSQPCLLNTRNADAKTIADLGPQDRIAVPTVKVSIQAVTLQMAAAKLFGASDYAKLDPLTVSMSPPDATASMLSGAAGISCVFSVPPFQQQQLDNPAIHTLLNSFDVAGPHSFTLCWAAARFRERNPLLYQAVVAALKEATAIVNADKPAAGALWLEDSKSKLPIEKITQIITNPQVQWTMTPQATERYAAFMHTAGSIKVAPGSWRELFFPEVHGFDGS